MAVASVQSGKLLDRNRHTHTHTHRDRTTIRRNLGSSILSKDPSEYFHNFFSSYMSSTNTGNWQTYLGKMFLLAADSPLPLGPPAVGVWADHSACQLAHTVLGWWCSLGPGSLHPSPGVSLRPVCSCGCGTTSPGGAVPHLGPQVLDVLGGWATGPLGPALLQPLPTY